MYEIHGVLNEALKLIHLCMRMPCRIVLELAGHSAADDRERFCTDLLSEEEVFIEAETV